MPKIVSLSPSTQAAAGLTANRATIEDIEAALLRAPNFLASLGLHSEDGRTLPLEQLGLGHYAHAFLLPSGLVLKVTDDEDDARVCKMIMDLANGKPGLPFIEAVYRLPGDVYENETDEPFERPLFAIVMEPVAPASKAGLSRTRSGEVRGRLLGEAVLYPSMEAELATDEARVFVKTIRRGVHWLAQHGVSVVDLHHGNFGYASGKRPVLIDFGHGSLQDEFIMKPIEMATNPGNQTLLFHGTDAEFTAPSVRFTGREAIFANEDPEEAAVWGDRLVALRLRSTARVKELTHKRANVAFWSVKESRRWRSAGFDAVLVLADPDNSEEAYRYNIWILLSDDAFDTELLATNQSTDRDVRAKAGLAPNGRKLSRAQRAFDECFDVVEERFPDFGDIELHEDEKAGSDNGHGSERQFGYCMDGKPIRIAFAAKIEKLPVENIRGLMAHEFGHALDYRYGKKLSSMLGVRLPEGVERRADAIAKAVFGRTIKYDEGLIQCVDCKGTAPRPRRLGP